MDNKYSNIQVKDFLDKLNDIIIGRSLTYPEGWIYKQDLLDMIEKLDWRELYVYTKGRDEGKD